VFAAAPVGIAFPVIGCVLDGIAGAATVFVLGELGVGLGIWISARRPTD
jgi:hypothetical protein